MQTAKKNSTTTIVFEGESDLSEFRLNLLFESIQRDLPKIKSLRAKNLFFINSDNKSVLSRESVDKLTSIIDAKKLSNYEAENSFIVIPRLGTISPWSSKSSEIIKNSGFNCGIPPLSALCTLVISTKLKRNLIIIFFSIN